MEILKGRQLGVLRAYSQAFNSRGSHCRRQRGQVALGAKREEEGRSRQGWVVVGRAWWELTSRCSDIYLK